ncbi:MAG: histidine--tRNA ligase [Candidatus Levybacteria bacterium]|nr:histidine--tRNA ligase [Candidatus Levybacteria bacterium]
MQNHERDSGHMDADQTQRKSNQPLAGFQELWGQRMIQRERIMGDVIDSFRLFGFQPQVLPSLHLAESLEKGSGMEQKMIYNFTDHGDRHVALRFDHTVPLRDFVERNYSKLTFPYRRYEVGNVWRADRPAKGRYREFAQMDVDIIGDSSVQADIESALLIDNIMRGIGVDATVRINSREILGGLIDVNGLSENEGINLLRVIDKFDKVGLQGVAKELQGLGFNATVISNVERYLSIQGSNDEVFDQLDNHIGSSEKAKQGLDRLAKVFYTIKDSGYESGRFRLDPSIARGLDYYTGLIAETTFNPDPTYGSICSGGRYDHFIRKPDGGFIPAIGVSIGIDRLLAAMESKNLLPDVKTNTRATIVNFGDNMLSQYLKLAGALRAAGIPTEINPSGIKLKGQMGAISKRGVPYAVILGSDEISRGVVKIKNMTTFAQEEIPLEQLTDFLREKD